MSVWAQRRSVTPANNKIPKSQRERGSVWKTFLVAVNFDNEDGPTNLIVQLGFVSCGRPQAAHRLIISISHAILAHFIPRTVGWLQSIFSTFSTLCQLF